MFNYTNFILFSRNVLKNSSRSTIQWNLCNNFTSSAKPKNHYETLNLSKDCSSKEIRDAFISLSKQFHPDKNKDNPKAQEQFVKVSEAYNVLIKPESRRDYDFNLQYNNKPTNEYRSPNDGDFYRVHRHDQHYSDPWKDPSFARNRNFSQENNDRYYGMKGIKRQSNDRILILIMIFAGLCIFIQISVIRFSGQFGRDSLDRYSEQNRQYLESVKARADMYSTRERQIEEYKRRMNQNNKDE